MNPSAGLAVSQRVWIRLPTPRRVKCGWVYIEHPSRVDPRVEKKMRVSAGRAVAADDELGERVDAAEEDSYLKKDAQALLIKAGQCSSW